MCEVKERQSFVKLIETYLTLVRMRYLQNGDEARSSPRHLVIIRGMPYQGEALSMGCPITREVLSRGGHVRRVAQNQWRISVFSLTCYKKKKRIQGLLRFHFFLSYIIIDCTMYLISFLFVVCLFMMYHFFLVNCIFELCLGDNNDHKLL